MFRKIVRGLMFVFFRVKVYDLDNYSKAGDRVLLVINPSSLWDPLLIAAFLPEKITLAVDVRLKKKWWMRIISIMSDTIEIDTRSASATRVIINAIEKNKRCMVFHATPFQNDPRYMRILESTCFIAKKANAVLLPIRIDGANYSRVSYTRAKQRLRYFPKITMTVLPPQKLQNPEGLTIKQSRQQNTLQLYSLMADLRYHSNDIDKNIAQGFASAVKLYGRSWIIAEDQDRICLTYGAMFTKAQALGRSLARELKDENYVGFMLPSSLVGAVAFLALHLVEKVPTMINFTAGIIPILSGCQTVNLKTIVTAKKFIKLGELEPLEKALLDAGYRLIYLEDISANMPLQDKLAGALASILRKVPNTPATEPAAILFTSGTEGLPKAVLTSHRSINANREQLLSIVSITSGDRFFNCLPLFHTFGLGVGTLLPLLSGIRVFFYPSPLHYKQVPRSFYESQSTVIVGTDTFFSGYARYSRPYDFANARLVIAGAERLQPSTAKLWKDRFDVTIFEGYGVTETSPVISVNTTVNTRQGSVGRFLPGMQYRIKPVKDVKEGGTLWVKGDNVMLGYMKATNPGVLEAPFDGNDPNWHDTGDIVDVDADGFIYIKGRAKRFAKVGGEMISLAAVENALRELWPDNIIGIVNLPDPRKGEQLALIIDRDDATTAQIATFFANQGLSSLWNPKIIIGVEEPPLLGTGKFDYTTAKLLAEEKVNKPK